MEARRDEAGTKGRMAETGRERESGETKEQRVWCPRMRAKMSASAGEVPERVKRFWMGSGETPGEAGPEEEEEKARSRVESERVWEWEEEEKDEKAEEKGEEEERRSGLYVQRKI